VFEIRAKAARSQGLRIIVVHRPHGKSGAQKDGRGSLLPGQQGMN